MNMEMKTNTAAAVVVAAAIHGARKANFFLELVHKM